jgi:hypothetical protein
MRADLLELLGHLLERPPIHEHLPLRPPAPPARQDLRALHQRPVTVKARSHGGLGHACCSDVIRLDSLVRSAHSRMMAALAS